MPAESMSGGRVSRLHLRAPPGQVAAARMRVEDAMRLADTDDRLLLLRRLDLGRMPVGAPSTQWAMRASERVAAQRARAVHAMTPGAASADAVWFHSPDEAWALLLMELAAGRSPSAWFWRLAVHGWNDAPLRAWLPRLVAEAIWDPPRDVALARAIVRALAAVGLDSIAAALAMAPMPVAVANAEPAESGQIFAPATTARPPALDRARQLLARLDPAVRAIILRWITAGAAAGPARAWITAGAAAGPARAWIIRFALVSVAPELITHPALLAAVSEAVIEIALARSRKEQTPPRADTIERESPPRPGDAIENGGSVRPVAGMEFGEVTVPSDSRLSMPPKVEPGLNAEDVPPALLPATQPGPAATDEAPSAAAGLFLLIRPLVMMGLPEWLDRRPDLAADGFARTLLHAIARRMRVPDDDPAIAVLALDFEADGLTDAAGHLTAWRVGLDRWLRRRARIKLAEVVRRRGWITTSGEALSVRFRVDAADLRLRRYALDIDPGWVPFLGLVVRYHYRDEPSG